MLLMLRLLLLLYLLPLLMLLLPLLLLLLLLLMLLPPLLMMLPRLLVMLLFLLVLLLLFLVILLSLLVLLLWFWLPPLVSLLSLLVFLRSMHLSFAVSAYVLNVCVSVFKSCNLNSDFYIVNIWSPNDDNEKLVSASFICNPLLKTIPTPPLPFNYKFNAISILKSKNQLLLLIILVLNHY